MKLKFLEIHTNGRAKRWALDRMLVSRVVGFMNTLRRIGDWSVRRVHGCVVD